MIRKFTNAVSFLIAGIILLLVAIGLHFAPSTFWIEVRSIRVFDAQAGEPVLMAVDRTIKRPFSGKWVVSVRRLMTSGRQSLYCTASGETDYQVDSEYPEPLTLRWWTFPNCDPLPPGTYVINTTWTVEGDGFLLNRRITKSSNIFQITAIPPETPVKYVQQTRLLR